ncbi:MAG: cyclopropane fatty acyl phospholipid synthase [Alphaproteobacteria bacterium]|nr:cyclopropane fatty acyl phospholipid synthase [Alphaproteobacteria bacterium]
MGSERSPFRRTLTIDAGSKDGRLDQIAVEPSGAGLRRRKTSKAAAVERLMAQAGIRLGGDRPWDIRIHNDRMFARLLAHGSLGLGEAYMDGDWDCPRLDEFFERVIAARLSRKLGLTFELAWLGFSARLLNRQSIRRARRAATVHYDLPVDIFEATFDARLTGSCAYWANAETLDAAQEAKLDLICRKIGLEKGHTVYDIGCGWGSFIGFAAERYGAECTGVTISPVQADYVARRYAGLPARALVSDYRNFEGPPVDRVVSVGMFEHVGARNYRRYFELARRQLKPDGLFVLHSIFEGEPYPAIDPWQDKYIFPNGDLPSLGQITSACEGSFVVEDVHNIGADYDRTLMAWNQNFQNHRAQMSSRHGERFCRMWEYYLLQNAAAFRTRYIQVGQLVLSPGGIKGGYRTIR